MASAPTSTPTTTPAMSDEPCFQRRMCTRHPCARTRDLHFESLACGRIDYGSNLWVVDCPAARGVPSRTDKRCLSARPIRPLTTVPSASSRVISAKVERRVSTISRTVGPTDRSLAAAGIEVETIATSTSIDTSRLAFIGFPGMTTPLGDPPHEVMRQALDYQLTARFRDTEVGDLVIEQALIYQLTNAPISPWRQECALE
jgi:hypothetical protein